MSLSIHSDLERQMIAAIEVSDLRPCLKAVGALPQLDGRNLISRFQTDAPAAYVSFSDYSVDSEIVTFRYQLAAITRNAAGHDAAVHGDKTTIGLYELALSLVVLGNGLITAGGVWHLDGRVAPIHAPELFNAGVYGCTVPLSVSVTLPDYIDIDALAAFETFHAALDVPPHTQSDHQSWASEDQSTSAPDAQDNVELEQ